MWLSVVGSIGAMPEWVISLLVQGGIGIIILARMSALLEHLKEDVKDMQRSKLDTEVYRVSCEKTDLEIRHLGNDVRGVSQRVAGLESAQKYNDSRPRP